MSNIAENKRLNEDELEAISGGVTAPPVDPAALAAQIMQSALNSALSVAGGGTHAIDTPAPTHTDTGTHAPTATTTDMGAHIASTVQTVKEDSHGPSQGAPIGGANYNSMLRGNLNVTLPPGAITEDSPTVQVMHFENTGGVFTKVTPVVVGVEVPPSNSGGSYGIPNRLGMGFNTAFSDDDKK